MGPTSCFRRLTAAAGLGRVRDVRRVSSDARPARGVDGMTAALWNLGRADIGRAHDGKRHGAPPREAETRRGLQVRKHHGIWQVRVDGVFHGDYHHEEPARAAAALLRQTLL